MKQKSFGKLPSGERLTRISSSPQYNGSSFQNIVETKMMADDASYIKMIWNFFGKIEGREPADTLPVVKTDLQKLATPSIVWFGHSTLLIAVDGKHILVDPILSDRPSPVQYAGSKSYPGTRIYSSADLPALDVIVISHDHYDHLDYNTIIELDSKTKLFCVPLGVGSHLEHWGVSPGKIIELDWWQQAQPGLDISLTCTPARHFSGRGFTRDKTLWASFVLEVGGYKIFIGGDSGYDDAFKMIGEKFGPFDIAMLECGQYDKQWPFIHMMPEETVQASVDLNAKMLLPIHWGKFTLSLHPWKDPIIRALSHAEKMNVKMATPKIGEPIPLNSSIIPMHRWWEYQLTKND